MKEVGLGSLIFDIVGATDINVEEFELAVEFEEGVADGRSVIEPSLFPPPVAVGRSAGLSVGVTEASVGLGGSVGLSCLCTCIAHGSATVRLIQKQSNSKVRIFDRIAWTIVTTAVDH